MCVVLSHCAHVVRQDLQYILSRCKMLHAFTFNPHPHPGFEFSYEASPGQIILNTAAFNPSWVLDVAPQGAGSLLARLLDSRLLTLSLDITTDGDILTNLARILSSAPRLTSLDLGTVLLTSSGIQFDPWSTLPDLSFPALTSLSIHCDALPFVEYVAAQWTMPRLASLYCKADLPVPVLAAHGQQLTYLHICSDRPCLYLSSNTALLPRLHALCSRLSHLAIRLAPHERTALNLNSPSLRYLDIIAVPSVSAYRAITLAPTAHAPQLKKVRMVMAIFDYFPLHFHPSRMPGSDRALEDLSDIPGADESDDRADWLMLTTGGLEAWCPEGLVRQHSWAVVIDELCEATQPPGAEGDSRIPDDDETDSEGVYEYESRPTSPVDSESDDSDAGGEEDPGDDDCGMEDARSEEGLDSDMEREWFEVEPGMPPYPNKVQFIDDPLDSSRGQYGRETILERFCQSQLGDFLLE
ncbi:hypothetical protein V8D89_004000 [Ganoderma adspersum]